MLLSLLPGLKTQLTFWSLVVAGIAGDLWSKAAIFAWLRQKQQVSVSIIDGFFWLVMTENTGAAFGIATGQTRLLIVISTVALVAIIAIFLSSKNERRLVHVALGLFTAGICGNLWDRIFNDGRVRDFIDIVYWPGKHWPAFNIADSMLCIGVGLMIISSLTEQSYRKCVQQRK
ncbi:MAG: signal peptidase II [Planctomycetes bacterium]|nr:signal peptidase II [Planctomycetota bacterium]